MILIQVSYSLVTLLATLLVVFQYYPNLGVTIGLVMQCFWVHYWIVTSQQGIILLDIGILIIYILRIFNVLKNKGK